MHDVKAPQALVSLVLAVALPLAPLKAQGTTLAEALEEVGACFDKAAAMELVAALDPHYRMRGNQGYTESLEALFAHLEEAGFQAQGGGDTVEYKDFGPVRPAWTPFSARLEVSTPDIGVLHSFEDESGVERTFLCGNSFPTRPEGVMAPLVEYEHSKPVESYAGSVVYGSLPAETLFARAVQQGGALGVISSFLPHYNDPETNRTAIRYSSVPYDAERKGFGLNVSPEKRDVLERLLAGGMVYVRVVVNSRFNDARSRTLVARIQGSEPHAGTVALVSHLDEPGANDNASGAATNVAMAAGYLRAIKEGRVPRPRRPITFLVGMEFECSREWLRSSSDTVDLALVIDMVGQGKAGNGAEPLVERMPDPGAIWDRPPLDVHSEWGRGDVRQSDLSGNFLNDYVMAAMNNRRAQNGWPVRSNPYEGGSDHESFLDRGIPAVLLWHFTDPYYHTNLDRLDKVDPNELENVAHATLGLVHHFAQAGASRAEEVLNIVVDAAHKRLHTESDNARAFLEAVADDASRRALVIDRERTIMVAWSHWYREAVLSVEHFETGLDLSEERRTLEQHIDKALSALRDTEQEALAVLEG